MPEAVEVNGLLQATVQGTLYPNGATVQERRLQQLAKDDPASQDLGVRCLTLAVAPNNGSRSDSNNNNKKNKKKKQKQHSDNIINSDDADAGKQQLAASSSSSSTSTSSSCSSSIIIRRGGLQISAPCKKPLMCQRAESLVCVRLLKLRCRLSSPRYQATADAWFAAAEQMSLANSACTVTRLAASPFLGDLPYAPQSLGIWRVITVAAGLRLPFPIARRTKWGLGWGMTAPTCKGRSLMRALPTLHLKAG